MPPCLLPLPLVEKKGEGEEAWLLHLPRGPESACRRARELGVRAFGSLPGSSEQGWVGEAAPLAGHRIP